MAELQLEGLSAEGVAEHLVAEADAEDRRLAHEPAQIFMHVSQRRGIAGAIGKEHAVRLERQHLRGRGVARAPPAP